MGRGRSPLRLSQIGKLGFAFAVGGHGVAHAEPSDLTSAARVGDQTTAVPLLLNGELIGDVHVDMSGGGVSFDADDFYTLADPELDDASRTLIRIVTDHGRLTPFDMAQEHLSLRYDENQRMLLLQAPAASHVAPASARPVAAATAAATATTPLPPDTQAPDATAPLEAEAVLPVVENAPTVIEARPISYAPVIEARPLPPLPAQPTQSPPPPTVSLQPAASTTAEPSATERAPSTPAAAAAPIHARATQLDFVYPLMMDGSYQGDIPVHIAADGSITISADRLLGLIGGQFEARVLDAIRAHIVDGRIAPFEDASGVALEFDEGLQELHLRAPAGLRHPQQISIGGAPPAEASLRLQHAAPLSAYLNYDITQAWDEDPTGPSGREALQGVLEGGVRIFGDSGFALESRALYQEGADHEFSRGETLLVYDDVAHMISVELGDVRMDTSTFQSAPTIGGLLIQRTFSLQPTRNYRPAGSHAIVLDRRTSVNVIVNGAEMRRLDLAPGRYDLRDFPFVDGANDVVLELEDDLGQRNTIDLSSYFDNELLAPGVSEFSYALGVPSTTEAEGITYDSKVFVYSMFHRLGVTPTLTVGVNAQGRDSATLFGADALWAAPIGTIGLDYAHSRNPLVGEGDAAVLRYSFQPRPSGRFSWNFTLSSQWQSPRFAAIDATAPDEQFTTQTDASLRLYHPDWGTLTFGASYDQAALSTLHDRYEASFGYSRRLFGNLYAALQITHMDDGDQPETTGAFSLSLRLGQRDQVTARADTSTQVSELDWHHSGSYGVGGLSTDARVGHDMDTGESFANGALSYFGNRFEATLSEDTRTVGLGNDQISSITTARIGGSVAFAGTHVAIGRPVRGAFAIIEGHPSLENRQVVLGRDSDGNPRAETGWLGAALVPNLSPYAHESVAVDVDNLPPGYDLGAGQLDFRAYRGAGYDVRVGSDANITVLANLVGPEGISLSMMGGELRSLDHPDAPPIQGFSNRSGRFVAAGISPGRYRLTMFTDPPTHAQITISASRAGLVQLGDVHLEESQ